jgi:hypothetical protein
MIFLLSFLFLGALVFKMHDWSITQWHEVIDHSPQSEIVAGHSRSIRSDDWALDLPLALSQLKNPSQFSDWNSNIGFGQDVSFPMRVPTLSFISLFRPFTWGYFLGADYGLAWEWWGLAVGLFYSFFLVFMLITRNQFGLSTMCSFFLLYSPYFQVWSLHKGEIAFHWALAFVSLAYLLGTSSKLVILLSSAILSWNLVGLVVDHPYPPICVPMAWLWIVCAGTYAFEHRSIILVQKHRAIRLAALILSGTLAIAGLMTIFFQHRDAIELIRNTVYPGRRFMLGGGHSFWMFFSNLFSPNYWRRLNWMGNECENSSFLMVFPLLLFAEIFYWWKTRKCLSAWTLPLCCYAFFVMAYSVWGLPRVLAQVTFFGMSTPNRTQMILGVINAILLAAVLSKFQLFSKNKKDWIFAVGAWAIFILMMGFSMKSQVPLLSVLRIFGVTCIYTILAAICFMGRQTQVFLGILAAASFIFCASFNPIVHGGMEFIYGNPLAKKIEEIDAQIGRKPIWAVYGEIALNVYIPLIGSRGLGGYHGSPHLNLWAQFDPSGQFMNVYNQCGYVRFQVSHSQNAEFITPSPGVIVVKVNPSSPVFSRLGVQYFLAEGKENLEIFENSKDFEELYSYGQKKIFKKRPS